MSARPWQRFVYAIRVAMIVKPGVEEGLTSSPGKIARAL